MNKAEFLYLLPYVIFLVDALAYIQEQSRKLFDPDIVAVFPILYHQG
jgi:hypothetical protein